VGPVAPLASNFLEQLDAMVQLGQALRNREHRHAALKQALADLYLTRIRRHGCTMTDAQALKLLALDIELNAQGMNIWLDRI
jgi:hypothetical protein